MGIKGGTTSESQENLVNVENGSVCSVGGISLVDAPSDIILTPAERQYLLYVQRGDVASVKRELENHAEKTQEFDKDCLDPLGRSAIAIAIENENLDLLELLLEMKLKPKDALLHAISEEYIEGVDLLLHFEEKHHVAGQPYSWEMMSRETAKFTKDITPLILAAHHNNYEILKILLDRGASLPMPHDIKCGCEDCIASTEEDSLRHSLSRINAYRALSSPSLISLSSKDPILTSFELSDELSRLMTLEHEFREDYKQLNEEVRKFCSELLDQIRTKSELATLLNYDPEGDPWVEGEIHSLSRLRSAIKYSQKGFVAHSNVQQMLGSIWYDGLPGFRRKTLFEKLFEIGKISCMFPIFSMSYIFNPDSEKGKFMKKPFVKFLCHCSSYMFFLMLLALASQRIEYLLIELFGNAWLRSVLDDWQVRERGSLPGIVEMFIIIYVFGLIWGEIKALWNDGLLEYILDLWNIVDFITNNFYVTWILLRITSWIIVHRDLWLHDEWPWYPREEWHAFDPMLLSEGCFGAAMIFSYLKLINIFSVNPHLGPLQISLGRMIFDILKFFFLYTLVLFAFGCGLNQLMWYYANLEMHQCYHLPGGVPDYDNRQESCLIWRRFANLFETSQSLFWASFGLVELGNFELIGLGSFTRFWGLLMFGSYSVINVIVLLNLLIAMMSSSYEAIKSRADTEWKFARTKLWLSYFEDGGTVPPPFNLIPTPKTIKRILGTEKKIVPRGSFTEKSRKRADIKHQNVMRLLVRRYITEQQRKMDEKGVTEDDINEVKQDISTFRFELVNIMKQNGLNTSMAAQEDPTVVGKKGRAIERKLMKGFNIGLVEGLFNEVLTTAKKPKNIFTNLAKAFGKKQKTDWNSKVSRASIRVKDQIGSSEVSLRRSTTSIRRRIKLENEGLLDSMNPETIAEYNPNLQEYTPATRVAYAKFKVNTLKMEKEKKKREEKERELKEKAEEANRTIESEKENVEVEYRSPTPKVQAEKMEENKDLQELEKFRTKKPENQPNRNSSLRPQDSKRNAEMKKEQVEQQPEIKKKPLNTTETRRESVDKPAIKKESVKKPEIKKEEIKKTDSKQISEDKEQVKDVPKETEQAKATREGSKKLKESQSIKVSSKDSTSVEETKKVPDSSKTSDKSEDPKPPPQDSDETPKEPAQKPEPQKEEKAPIPQGKSTVSGQIRTGWL